MQFRDVPVTARRARILALRGKVVYFANGRRDADSASTRPAVGVGVRRDGASLWVTVIFEARRDPGTRLSMPSC